MNHSRGICLSFFILWASFAWSRFPLDFPADKNNIQVLPQKFEYSLRDSSKLLLGNRIIDTDQFRLDLTLTQEGKYQILISWPGDVVPSGRILFSNPSGLEVWSQTFSKGQKQLVVKDAQSLISRLSTLSFFKFCVGYYEIDTGLDVCSPELILKGTGQNISVAQRGDNQKPLVQINGRTVTHHGIVFLNDEKETLQFRAISRSGAEFRMDTRRTALEFTDVVEINDKSFMLTVEGPLPLAPSNIKKINEKRWSVPLLKERAQIYIAGGGQVPLRQEFIVLGPLPKATNRVFLKTLPDKKTYSSRLALFGEVSQRGKLQPTDRMSEVNVQGNSFQWIVRNVPSGRDRTSYLGVLDGEQTFSAAYKTSRQDSGRLELGALFSSESRLAMNGEAQLWFENPLRTQVWTFHRLGVGLHHQQELSGDDLAVSTNLSLYFRLSPGLQFWDSSFLASLGMENINFESQSLQTFSAGVGWTGPNWKKIPYFEWIDADFRYAMPVESSSAEFKGSMLARIKLFMSLEDSQKWKVGFGFQSLELLANGVERKDSSVLIDTAWVKTF